MNKKRTSRRVNHKTKTPPEYQLVGSIEDSEEQTEHATIEQDNDYWTRETIGGPAQYDEEIYKALYSTDEEVEEMFATDDGFLTDDSYLNMNGTTQSANHQGQEIQTKMTYKEVEEMFSNDDGFFMDDEDVEEMFATDDGFLMDDLYLNMNGTTKSQGTLTDTHDTKRQNPIFKVYPWKKSIQKNKDQRKRISTNSNPSTKKQNRMKNKEQLNHTNWKTHEQKNLPKWTQQHLAAYLSIPEMALEWIVEPG